MKTTTVETSQLSGAALDWAVAKAVGRSDVKAGKGQCYTLHPCERRGYEEYRAYQPSTDWSQGGSLIEKYRVWIASTCTRGAEWDATVTARTFVDAVGPTPLIAACRAIVAAVLGDDVEVPVELVEARDA